jgi:hypothetical protein
MTLGRVPTTIITARASAECFYADVYNDECHFVCNNAKRKHADNHELHYAYCHSVKSQVKRSVFGYIVCLLSFSRVSFCCAGSFCLVSLDLG